MLCISLLINPFTSEIQFRMKKMISILPDGFCHYYQELVKVQYDC